MRARADFKSDFLSPWCTGQRETVILGQLDFYEGDSCQLTVVHDMSSSTRNAFEVHVSMHSPICLVCIDPPIYAADDMTGLVS